jgi:hypothetical protein
VKVSTVTLPSSRAPLPTPTQRTRPVTNNGKAFPQYCPASVRSFVTSSDVCLLISSGMPTGMDDDVPPNVNVAWEDSGLEMRGFAVGWSYLNRNASGASSGLRPSESVEVPGGERAGSHSLTTRNGMERVIRTW